MLEPFGFADVQAELLRLEIRDIRGLVQGVRYGQYDIDDRLGGYSRHGGRARVLDQECAAPERGANASRELLEALGPAIVVRNELDFHEGQLLKY